MPPEAPVSLITTFFNERASVERFFTGLRQWSRLPDEIVMVDGGSRDDTVAVIQACRTEAPVPVQLIETGGCNISEGRNIAIRHARHELIASTDMGCEVGAEWLERILAPFEDPAVDVVGGYYEPICRTPIQHCYHHLTYKPSLDPNHFLPSSRSLAFRRRVWEAVGGYPEHLTTAEDTFFDLRIREAGFREVFAHDARVRWEGRDSYSSIFRQYFRYARGAGLGLIQPRQYGFYIANYLTLALWPVAAWALHPAVLALSAAHLAWFLHFRIFRKQLVRAHLTPANLLRYLGITLAVDMGSDFGYPVGLCDAVFRRRRRFVPPEDRGSNYGEYWQSDDSSESDNKE